MMTKALEQPASLSLIDTMVEFAVAHLVQNHDGHRSVTRELVTRWPDAEGLQVVFVLVSAAHAMEAIFDRDPHASNHIVDQVFRLAALLATDLFALRQRGQASPTGADLLAYWQQSDPYFLNL